MWVWLVVRCTPPFAQSHLGGQALCKIDGIILFVLPTIQTRSRHMTFFFFNSIYPVHPIIIAPLWHLSRNKWSYKSVMSQEKIILWTIWINIAISKAACFFHYEVQSWLNGQFAWSFHACRVPTGGCDNFLWANDSQLVDRDPKVDRFGRFVDC